MNMTMDKILLRYPISQIRDQLSALIVSNRGPVSLVDQDDGSLGIQRNSGGLVTALLGLARQIDMTWLACAQNSTEVGLRQKEVLLENGAHIQVEFIDPGEEAYNGYYNIIANPLLWFLQHSMWNTPLAPVIDRSVWQAWDEGYVIINQLFAHRIIHLLQNEKRSPLIMLQDYHLYLTARHLRQFYGRSTPTISHFTHIPWPGPESWGLLPGPMREAILDGLCAADLLGFQTRQDGLNFIRTCDAYLPSAEVKYTKGMVQYQNHTTHVRDFPISIDVDDLKSKIDSPEVVSFRDEISALVKDHRLILRIDRIEPSKNIIRGFQAFAELLEHHPEHRGKVVFLALLSPSRQEIDEYKEYLDVLMTSVGRVNARYGNCDWEPVRVLIGENYNRAIAALQLYDILLVNAIADGMNLVAKEGPIVNGKDGVLVLSDRAGAWQQLESGSIVISPCDIVATAEALHQGLTMDMATRHAQAIRLRELIEREDINAWLNAQLQTVTELNL